MPKGLSLLSDLSRGNDPGFALESTLQELPLHDVQLEFHQLGITITHLFEANPILPGVILTNQGQFAGMISRRRFLESMSHPYGLALFSKRPVKQLYHLVQGETLMLPGSTLIVAAARDCLQRPAELLYEPIVVEVAAEYRLLDVHQLLIAQSQIHELTTALLTQLYQQLETANQELHRLARLDGLTQISNRRHFDEHLDKEWRRLAREQAQISLLLADIDCFKRYNDEYGHLAGDDCLRQIASAMQACVNRPADLLARYGGEEFAVVLPSTDVFGAVCVAEAIRRQVRALALSHAQSSVSPYITLSIGVASMVPHPSAAATDLIAAADRALYEAKARGRDRITLNPFLPQL